MLVKTPTRSSVHRKSCNVRAYKEGPLVSSDSKTSKAANSSIANPQKRKSNKKKLANSLGCIREKTQSTKASKRRHEEVSNFESYSDSLGRSIHHILDNSLMRIRPPMSDVKHTKRTKHRDGLFSNENIEQLLHQRRRYLEESKASNDRLEEYLRLLKSNQKNIVRRNALADQSRARLNQSWREMCLLLESNHQTTSTLENLLESHHSALAAQQTRLLEQEKFEYLKLFTRKHK